MLADFHPKGDVSRSFGLYLEAAGINDRATVIIDAGGVVQHISAVTPSGRRNIAELAELCAGVDNNFSGTLPAIGEPRGIAGNLTLYVKSSCGFSRKALLALANVHLAKNVAVKNVSEDAGALKEMVALAGKDQAPCLIVEATAIQDSDEIVSYFVERGTAL